jgi:hypothetical protein
MIKPQLPGGFLARLVVLPGVSGAAGGVGARSIETRRPPVNRYTPGQGPARYVSTRERSPRALAPSSIFSTGPARCTTSHSVICNAMPPGVSGSVCAGPAAVPAGAGWGRGPHCPSCPTMSAVVTVPELLLPQACVEPPEVFGEASGLGPRVRLLRLRSAEQAPRIRARTIAVAHAPTRFGRCIARGKGSMTGRVIG